MQEETIMIEEVTPKWLDDELKSISTFEGGERLPIIKFEEDTIHEIKIDFSKPFPIYKDVMNNSTKKIIPITFKGERMCWFLNVQNPIYHKILEAGRKGQSDFKILRTGQMKNTKYNLVK